MISFTLTFFFLVSFFFVVFFFFLICGLWQLVDQTPEVKGSLGGAFFVLGIPREVQL